MSKKIFLLAGEESGDLLGASLLQDLQRIHSDLIVRGVGGAQMQAHGLQSIFPLRDLSVMGLFEVLRHLPRLRRRFYEALDAVGKFQPDILVTIDAPDFSFRLAKAVKKKWPHIKTVHMVAPTVWAWRPGRAKKISEFLDGLLCLFPFEAPYFEKHGLKTQFVGHPLAQMVPQFFAPEKASVLHKYGFDGSKPLLCLLPGSRRREIDTLMPLFANVLNRLRFVLPNLQVVLPTLPHLHERVIAHLAGCRQKVDVVIPTDAHDRFGLFAASTAALHASGTVALELGLSLTPMVTTYRVSALTAWLIRKLLKISQYNLVNILAGHAVIPEFMQEEAVVEKVAPAIQYLLQNPAARQSQIEALHLLRPALQQKTPQSAAFFVSSYF